MNYIFGPFICVFGLLLIVVLPPEVKRRRGVTIVYLIIAAYASLSVIFWAVARLLARHIY